MKHLLLFLTFLIISTAYSQPCSVFISVIQNPSCTFCSDGILMANPTGTAPFTYTWTPTQITLQIAGNLPTGFFAVCIQDATGCIACDTITLTESVGIQKISDDQSKLFSPNPFTDKLTFTADENSVVTLFNAMGEAVIERSIGRGDQILKTKFLPSGIYFIRLQTQTSSIVARIMKD